MPAATMFQLKTTLSGILLLALVTQSGWLQANPQNSITDRAKVDSRQSTDGSRFPQVDWSVGWSIDRERPGYPLLKSARHFSVQHPSEQAGAYHHHPQITCFGDRLIATWSNHPSGEDGPGQKVLGASSTDGERWQSIGSVFEPRDLARESTANGRALIASPFIYIEDRLFAVAVINDGIGYGSFNSPVTGAPSSIEKTTEFVKRIRRPHGFLIREIFTTGKLGETFWLGKIKPTPVEGFEELALSPLSPREFAVLQRKLQEPVFLSPWDFSSPATEIEAKDGHLLCEPTTVQTDDGILIRYLRDHSGSHRLYVQFSDDDGASWTVAEQTNIPDAPSKSVMGKLPDGSFCLIGNQVLASRETRRDPLTIGLSRMVPVSHMHTQFDGEHLNFRWRPNSNGQTVAVGDFNTRLSLSPEIFSG